MGIVTGAFGLGYFVYGKKQSRIVFMLTGIALMGYSYFFSTIIMLIIIGVILLVLPFVLKD